MDILNDDYLNSIDNEGFLVPKLEVEMPLYRYRGTPEHFIDEIANDHIFLSSLDKLNDPFDSSYSMSFEEACHEKIQLCFIISERIFYATLNGTMSCRLILKK